MKKAFSKVIQPGHILMGVPLVDYESYSESSSESGTSRRLNVILKNKKKILVADDEAFNILVIKGLMRVLGMHDIDSRVDCCHNGEQLIEHVEKAISEGDPYRYSLILTDCMMPFMDGYEATKRIRKLLKDYNEERLHIIAVTGHVEREYIIKAEKSGMDIVYPKPIPVI
jgi:CheY-like chemotaxis protein